MRTLLAILSLLALSGCRTVWLHPDATVAKFKSDRAQCMALHPSIRWQTCMRNLGWDAEGRMFSRRIDNDGGTRKVVKTIEEMRAETGVVTATLVKKDWHNDSVRSEDRTRVLGKDKAACMERGYVGQRATGQSKARIAGYNGSVGGRMSGDYNSEPVFDKELFTACMNAAGWELTDAR